MWQKRNGLGALISNRLSDSLILEADRGDLDSDIGTAARVDAESSNRPAPTRVLDDRYSVFMPLTVTVGFKVNAGTFALAEASSAPEELSHLFRCVVG